MYLLTMLYSILSRIRISPDNLRIYCPLHSLAYEFYLLQKYLDAIATWPSLWQFNVSHENVMWFILTSDANFSLC